jgi:hypothetical protein
MEISENLIKAQHVAVKAYHQHTIIISTTLLSMQRRQFKII